MKKKRYRNHEKEGPGSKDQEAVFRDIRLLYRLRTPLDRSTPAVLYYPPTDNFDVTVSPKNIIYTHDYDISG